MEGAKDQAARKARKVLIRTLLGIGAPLMALFILVFLIILLPFVNGTQQGSLIGGPNYEPLPTASPSASLTPGPGTPTPIKTETPDCGQVDSRLMSEFRISITGTGCPVRQQAYTIYASLSRSPEYRSLLASVRNGIRIRFDPSQDCKGKASGNTFMVGRCTNPATIRYMLIHEMSHVIRNHNYSLISSRFPLSSLSIQDNNCYDGKFLKSYGLREGITISESFAEAMALYYLNNHPGYGVGSPIRNFKQECNDTYNIMRANFFGGYEFN